MALFTDIPAATAGDWWVTAGRSLDRIKDLDAAARSAPDLLATLTEIAALRRAADTALGAAAEALLADGAHWEDIAPALGTDSAGDARVSLSIALEEARLALHRRLGNTSP